jgi:putative metallohydrolase (TIGR04338 family)
MPSSAVYAAEDQWSAVLDRGGTVDFFGSRIDVPMQRRFGDLASVQRYVADVMTGPFVAVAYPDAGPVTVRERSGQRGAHYEPGPAVIAIPLRTMWAAREAVVLHEIAHHLACSTGPVVRGPRWHGTEYRSAMCGLVAATLGEPAALLLRAGYEESGVRL